MKISKVIFHIKPILSHPWWECKKSHFSAFQFTTYISRQILVSVSYLKNNENSRSYRCSNIAKNRVFRTFRLGLLENLTQWSNSEPGDIGISITITTSYFVDLCYARWRKICCISKRIVDTQPTKFFFTVLTKF